MTCQRVCVCQIQWFNLGNISACSYWTSCGECNSTEPFLSHISPSVREGKLVSAVSSTATSLHFIEKDQQVPSDPLLSCTSSWRSSLMPRVNMAWKYGLERARRARWAGIRWSSATSTTSQKWLCRRCSLRPCRTSTAWSAQRNTCKHHNTVPKHIRRHGSQKTQLSKQWEAMRSWHLPWTTHWSGGGDTRGLVCHCPWCPLRQESSDRRQQRDRADKESQQACHTYDIW